MNTNNMPTIYKLVDEVCARDFPILAQLSIEQRKQFIDIIYDDLMWGDNPKTPDEDKIHERVTQSMARAISNWIEDAIDFIRNFD
jgi:hypothetical protein